MNTPLSDEQQGQRIIDLRTKQGLTQEMLAEQIGVDVGTVARWERGAHNIRPRNLAALATALGVDLNQLTTGEEPAAEAEPSERDLQRVEFIAWLATASGKDFDQTYQTVATLADQLEAESSSKRHARNHTRAGVTRQDLADAVADYYDLPNSGHQPYTATVAGKELTLTIVAEPSGAGANIDLRSIAEQATVAATPNGTDSPLSEAVFNAGAARLADAEVNNKVLMNNPMYRLLSVDIDHNTLHPTFAVAEFADYALRNGLMELETIDAVAKTNTITGTATPLRDHLLPTVDQALDFGSYYCTGGPVALVAIARPADGHRPPDYALLVQVRGKHVMDIAGKFSTVPKGWHQPLGEPSAQATLSTTLMRELEEELLGREDLEQLSDESRRTADPLHRERQPQAMLDLLDNPGSFHARCTGFGLNLLSGTYEVPCLIVIEDEQWWTQWGHLIAGNWETMSIDCYSSLDTQALTNLIHDPRWSNEGLYALLEGLRVLADMDCSGRTPRN